MSGAILRGGLDSPVGPLTLVVQDDAITEMNWGRCAAPDQHPVLEAGIAQMQAYFAGELKKFDLPLEPRVSSFQKTFGDALCAIPYGETRTYGDLARELSTPAQAIGQACGANPIAILIPCHRVLGATSLGGYSGRGGIEVKVELLKLEGAAGLLI